MTSLWLFIFEQWCKRSFKKYQTGSESGSDSQRYGSADPDPYQYVTDPQLKYMYSIVVYRYGIYFLETFLPVLALLIDKRVTAHRLFCFNSVWTSRVLNFPLFTGLSFLFHPLIALEPEKFSRRVSVFHASPWNWQGLCYSYCAFTWCGTAKGCGVERLWCGVADKLWCGLNKLWCGVVGKFLCGFKSP